MYIQAINISAHRLSFYIEHSFRMLCTIISIIVFYPFVRTHDWKHIPLIKHEEVEFKGRKIEFIQANPATYQSNWYEAQAICNSRNMDLVTIDSEEKNALFAEHMRTYHCYKFWIGLKSELPETLNELEITGRKASNFYWFANHQVTKLEGKYTNWCPGQPKPSGKADDVKYYAYTFLDVRDMCGAIAMRESCWKVVDCITETGSGWACEERLPRKIKYKYPKSMDTYEFKGAKYTFHDDVDVTWKEADQRCNSNSQKLVCIENNEEFDFIKTQITGSGYSE
uniref:C-type lectin domain-containing protein n=1 Tax=Strigamia maritima TaxID=126957 RepID=T1IMU5_STRMM